MTRLSKEEFFRALEAARQPRGSGGHPFSRAWAEGRLSRAQLGQWATQHYYYISAIPQQFAALFARMPDEDGRHLLMENLVGEEMPHAPEKSHPNLLLRFAEACGLEASAVKAAEQRGQILPATRAMRAWIWELSSIRPLGQSCAGIMVALEGQLPTLYPTYIAAMERMGFTPDDLEFFHVHVENDVEHAAVGLELCDRYCPTAAEQNLAIEAVKTSAALRYNMLSEMEAAILLPQAA
ncbi:MAG: TenA family transcriptional regulator [Thermaurantiacus tibetensis]|uniref:TenA family transcriptional regulator n=1 Tax=Thermaurantiacus tibetensis TaxID=2759035 RepID=UPI00188EDB89|nr:iron-containing redox enzyme family protein [Thermaurantiacus tibetensis]